MIVFKSLSLYLAIAGILLAIVFSAITGRPSPPATSVQKPSVSPFSSYIAASGIVESIDKNIEVGSPEEGIVEKMWVVVGDSVHKGDPLFQIDTRPLKAKLRVQQAEVEVAKSTLEKQQDLFDRIQAVKNPQSVSREDFTTRENEMKIAQTKLKSAEAEMAQTRDLIEQLLVRAPKDGVILQENQRVGEYATKNNPVIVLGDLTHLQLRVSIDEQNAGKFETVSRAVAYPKNNTTLSIPLKFVRIEPLVIPKISLTGSSEERVDTRVLNVIYSFEEPKHYRFYVGQQADVYIEKDKI